ncbi:phospholipase C, phosphocholine-specific [Pseudoflavitalea sp. G-6-1-2]|uniref:phosphocholine-specific phospholipase C n=1 Tax=Pseudoflavitalea sp. G-6-1-2 TaxID=2728841 RepID=UPI00146F5DE4|nr:phospholipase C, phosphocholine-specific [Pseudoflavitalea sp. G-6-1-2]NML22917.1 phospholipase C, phosphocholine-specific [Pseudoflavitalea sp. G-6-1-2]
MDSRREFLKNIGLAAGGTGLLHMMPASIARALAIDPAPGSTYLDAEHIVFLMQENRSFDHAYGTLQGVRGFNDPRAIRLPNNNLVWLQTDKTGKTYCPFHLDIKNTKATWMSSLPHTWSDQVDARNNGLYDRWLHAKPSGRREYSGMPLTLGFHTREDIPFYYALADAFTVCDHNFCSSLTGTTPNRLYFWSGTLRESKNPETIARVWNDDADHNTMVSWTTFPERLEQHGVSWKVYQNEIDLNVGFEGEEAAWLSNFGDNPLEYFKQYNAKLHAPHIKYLPKQIEETEAEIKKTEQQLSSLPGDGDETTKAKKKLANLQRRLLKLKEYKQLYTTAAFDKLSPAEKQLHQKAFSTNSGDPDHRKLTDITYKDGDTERTMKAPKGDVLHQFRKDVQSGELPTVSWIVAPENFSDHPSAAWFGVWYISEVLDILTHNPNVWKKTIFVLTYDENDGYYDHLPPFVAPHPTEKNTGKVSAGIDTAQEYVTSKSQQSSEEDDVRLSSIGLGYRVPMVIASPWSRGGWVNSEVFDHTSSLQFLEHYLSKRTGKEIKEPNISEWRRTVCGDLSSVFRPYKGEKIELPTFLERDPFIEGIHKAQYKKLPDNFKALDASEISAINSNPYQANHMAKQEPGTRSANALPYELYADGFLKEDKKTILIRLRAGKAIHGERSAGSPFTVYARNLLNNQVQCRSYAVKAGDMVEDEWQLSDFENAQFALEVYGPNGFFREFKGSAAEPELNVVPHYGPLKKGGYSGNLLIGIVNPNEAILDVTITDNAYKTPAIKRQFGKDRSNATASIEINNSKQSGWYDISITIAQAPHFLYRLAGHVEDGKPGKTDPFMGRVI